MKTFETVCVIGLGYIGLPTAALIADSGTKVFGVDANPIVLSNLSNGRSGIEERGLDVLVTKVIDSGDLVPIETPVEANVYVICVPTPLRTEPSNGSIIPDLSHVNDAIDRVIDVAPDNALIIIESTCPVGTTEAIASRFLEKGRNIECMSFAYCPERVLPGNIINELKSNDRVIGGLDKAAAGRAATFYKLFTSSQLHQTNAATAELCKAR